MINEQELIKRVAEGSEEAFATLYHSYWESCYRQAFKILQDTQQSEDIVQELFVRIWEKRRELEIVSIGAYLQKATRNRVLNAIRSEKTNTEFYNRLARVTAELLEENPLLFKENEQLLEHLIESLPEDCRETFRLSRKNQLSYKEIALHLNVSEKTVEKRMSKALQHIRDNYIAYMLFVANFIV